MKMKTVSQCDDNGVYIGESQAQESPLEPGVFLIPRNAHDKPVPPIPAGMRAVWMTDAQDWRMEQIPADNAAPAQTAEDLEAQQELRYRAGAKAALDVSSDVVMFCYEQGIPVPPEWVSYRNGLRAVINAPTVDPKQPYPPKPATKPAGM